MINRREMLAFMAATPLFHLLSSLTDGNTSVVSATKLLNDHYLVTDTPTQRNLISIGFQPHGLVRLSPSRILVVGKRPSELMAVVNTIEGVVEKIIQLPHGRHFEGHAVTDHHTGIIYTSEFDFVDEVSVIGSWSINNLTALNVMPSGGITAHDMLIDDDQLFCANGGFKTAPEFSRMMLSDEISSNLSIFDKNTNTLIESVKPTEKHMSFRHLCQTQSHVYIGLQNKVKRDLNNQTIIAALDKESLDLKPILTQADGKVGYITSIANFQDTWIVATSHTNHAIYLINCNANHRTHVISARAPQGIQIIGDRLFVTAENGLIEVVNIQKSLTHFYPKPGCWQNHCVV